MPLDRKFKITQARRVATPLIVGIAGCGGSGKTYSALRLASGIASVTRTSIAVIDTEGGRALHYAPPDGQRPGPGEFDFLHIDLCAPFDPASYLAAIKQCAAAGHKTIIVDSMTHEHEGQGGCLEMVDQIRAKSNNPNEASHWAEPKRERLKLLDAIVQLRVTMILCFRAKDKLKLGRGAPTSLGWMPVGGVEYAYETTIFGVLEPGAEGVPTWKTREPGQKIMTKWPWQLRKALPEGKPFSEEMGAALARWSAGPEAIKSEPEPEPEPVELNLDQVIDDIAGQTSRDELEAFAAGETTAWRAAPEEQQREIREAMAQSRARLTPLHPDTNKAASPRIGVCPQTAIRWHTWQRRGDGWRGDWALGSANGTAVLDESGGLVEFGNADPEMQTQISIAVAWAFGDEVEG
jgi:hypothetical protein